MRGLRGALLVCVLAAVVPAAGLTQEDGGRDLTQGLTRPETILAALTALEVDRELEEQALVKDLNRLATWRYRRDELLERLRSLYGQQDLLFNTGDARSDPEGAASLERRILEAEALLGAVGHEGRALRERIDDRRDRMELLARRSDELLALLPEDVDSLTGLWDVRFVPTGEHGAFSLYQSGTLLSGEYVLGGGWHGSVQGTVVDGRVFLERIDSVKGRFADMTGRLSSDGQTIRGTWQERDLTANRASEGSWIATKRARRAPEAP